MPSNNRVKVLNVVRTSPSAIKTGEVKDATGLSYPTVIKWLEVLRAEGLVRYRTVGKSMRWFASEVIDGLSEEEIDRMVKLRKLGRTLGGQRAQEEAPDDFLLRLARGSAELRW